MFAERIERLVKGRRKRRDELVDEIYNALTECLISDSIKYPHSTKIKIREVLKGWSIRGKNPRYHLSASFLSSDETGESQ